MRLGGAKQVVQVCLEIRPYAPVPEPSDNAMWLGGVRPCTSLAMACSAMLIRFGDPSRDDRHSVTKQSTRTLPKGRLSDRPLQDRRRRIVVPQPHLAVL